MSPKMPMGPMGELLKARPVDMDKSLPADDDKSEGYSAMAAEVMAALDAKDPRALAEALKDFMAACSAEE